jgi:hypothetical protein
VFDPLATHFRTHRHRIPAARHRALREDSFRIWEEVARVNG